MEIEPTPSCILLWVDLKEPLSSHLIYVTVCIYFILAHCCTNTVTVWIHTVLWIPVKLIHHDIACWLAKPGCGSFLPARLNNKLNEIKNPKLETNGYYLSPICKITLTTKYEERDLKKKWQGFKLNTFRFIKKKTTMWPYFSPILLQMNGSLCPKDECNHAYMMRVQAQHIRSCLPWSPASLSLVHWYTCISWTPQPRRWFSPPPSLLPTRWLDDLLLPLSLASLAALIHIWTPCARGVLYLLLFSPFFSCHPYWLDHIIHIVLFNLAHHYLLFKSA